MRLTTIISIASYQTQWSAIYSSTFVFIGAAGPSDYKGGYPLGGVLDFVDFRMGGVGPLMSTALALLVCRTRAMLFDFVSGFGFKRFLNAATNAAIILECRCKMPRMCEAMWLI